MLGELYRCRQTEIQTYRGFLPILLKRLQTIHICCYRNKRYWVVLAVGPFYFVSVTFILSKNALNYLRFLRERERSLRERCLRERLLREPLLREWLFLEREARRLPPVAGAAATGAAALAGLGALVFFGEPKKPDRNPVEAGAAWLPGAGAGTLIYYVTVN